MNYISIHDKRIELTDEQAEAIATTLREWERMEREKKMLSDIPAGETFKIGKYEFVVLEQMGTETAVILKKLMEEEMTFGRSNHYKGSNVDEACCKFESLITEIVGDGNLVDHVVDLTSDDGLKDYGTITRRVSSLTAEQYRKYVEILDKYKPESWWWLATPFSTKRHDNDRWTKCVSPSGFLRIVNCSYDVIGVRPFCIFKSSIFVSFEN